MARKISASLDMDRSATPWPPQAGMSPLRGGHYLRKVWVRFQSSRVTGIILKHILTASEKPCEATETGNIEEVILITRDITERKKAEEEIKKLSKGW